MPPQLTDIKILYKTAIEIYSAALENCDQPNLRKFFHSYYMRRRSLLFNISEMEGSPFDDERVGLFKWTPFETLVERAIATEEALIEAYQKFCSNLEDDRLLRNLRLHLTELEISYKNMLIIIPFYMDKQVFA